MASWWAEKVRQVGAHVRARVSDAERRQLVTWLTADQIALFDGMHVADRRHGLDVVARLRADGATDPDLLVAGLLHDCAKGDTGVLPRIAFSLGQRYGTWIWGLAGRVPGWRAVLERLRVHAEASARLAAAAGCSPATVELIGHQDAPIDPVAGEQLRLADEAS
ncbi:MAG TPA: hypothetical protein VHM48_13255 [Candidatus Limnocylindrales bacterium]|nr:hypothetical protein [Candidatus Limnocylindrales bacterium]